MKIELVKDRKIKGKPRKAGEAVIVRKDLGERLISKGLANRITVASEDRGHRRFYNHRRF